MAIRDSNLALKGIKHRGTHGGMEHDVTGVIRLKDGESLATTDLINMVPMGESTRPIRLTLLANPVEGSPVITGGAMKVGVAPLSTVPFKRPDGTEYPAVATNDSVLGTLTIPAAGIITSVAVPRPAANTVARYGPYQITATPGAAFSVAGGDIDLSLTVTFLGEQKADGFVYTEQVNQKVKN